MNTPNLRKLADMYETTPSYLSIYLNLEKGVNEAFLRKRLKQCERALEGKREELANLQEAFARVEPVLREAGRFGGIAIFANPRRDYLEHFSIPADVEDRLVYDSSPYIRPLVRLHHEWEEYVVVVLDSTHARIFVVSQLDILQRDEVAEEIVRKHRKGGMSQMRFQRLHEGYVDRYFKEVAEHLRKEVELCRCIGRLRGIVLAGPREAKIRFEGYLPPELKGLVVAALDEPADVPECVVVRAAGEVVRDREGHLWSELMEKLKKEVLTNGLAAYGYEEVRALTAQGRVDTLLVQRAYTLRGWRCEHCRDFGEGSLHRCPNCGREPLSVDAVEELMELALDKSTAVEVLPADGGLGELGGVGALLRY